MRLTLVFTTVFFASVFATFNLKKPKALNFHGLGDPCNADDEPCCKKKFSSLVPLIVEFLGSPLAIPKLKVGYGKGVLQLDQTLENIKVEGLNKATVGDSKLDLAAGKMMLVLRAPQLKINTKYNINGRCLVLPLWGKGDGCITLKNVEIRLELGIGLDNGKLCLHGIKLPMKIGGANIKLSSLFGETRKKILTPEYEKVLNDNAVHILHDLLPDVTAQLEKQLLPVLKPVLAEIPLELILLLPVLS